jgi:hypothetical protein
LIVSGGNTGAENRQPAAVPYIVHESEMFRAERYNRRLWALCALLILALVISNAAWIMRDAAEMQQTEQVQGGVEYVGF